MQKNENVTTNINLATTNNINETCEKLKYTTKINGSINWDPSKRIVNNTFRKVKYIQK
jgi:hypothetical protein